MSRVSDTEAKVASYKTSASTDDIEDAEDVKYIKDVKDIELSKFMVATQVRFAVKKAKEVKDRENMERLAIEKAINDAKFSRDLARMESSTKEFFAQLPEMAVAKYLSDDKLINFPMKFFKEDFVLTTVVPEKEEGDEGDEGEDIEADDSIVDGEEEEGDDDLEPKLSEGPTTESLRVESIKSYSEAHVIDTLLKKYDIGDANTIWTVYDTHVCLDLLFTPGELTDV
jgi:hypothetical protein